MGNVDRQLVHARVDARPAFQQSCQAGRLAADAEV